ncbi:MAG: fibronectin type III domain-containing protein, partial [Actinomycetia bacterium]|nr:fibronectin type III domain-containing protein [Actinomycetes bacterium]
MGPARAATEPPYHVHLSWQHDPHTTVTVTWHNDTGLTGYAPVVRYGTSPGVYTKTTAGASHSYSGATVYVSDVELTGLTPDTRYYYRCGDATYGWSAEASFVTPPVVKKGFKFCAYGDSRDDWWPLYENNDFSIWGDIASRVQAEDPLFSIFTADFVSDGTSESSWNQWFTKFEPLSKKSAFLSCHGNHEKYADAFFDRFAFPENERWYSFDVSNVHFTCLDTGLSDNEPALIDQQKAWLSSDLAAADARGVDWKVVYFHRSPYATSTGHGNQDDVIAGWVPIFDQYKVDVVFNGHNHYYERSYPMRGGVPITGSLDYYWQPDGVVYVTAGCAGAPLVNTGSAPWVAKNAKEYNYCVVDVLPNRSMRVQAKKRDGSLLEQFTIAKDNAPILYSVSPSTARAGEEVTVSGKRFGLERGSSAVWFGSTRATEYASWSDEQVKVRVPGGVSGQVQLKVQTQDGSSKTVPFTVLLTPSDQAPTITSISPCSGSVGTTVTIKGTSFGSSRGTSYVKFNTTEA